MSQINWQTWEESFYEGVIAEAIIKTTSGRNHKLTLDDLKNHTSTIVEPIKLNFQDYNVWKFHLMDTGWLP